MLDFSYHSPVRWYSSPSTFFFFLEILLHYCLHQHSIRFYGNPRDPQVHSLLKACQEPQQGMRYNGFFSEGGVCCPLSHADAAMLARHKLAHQPPVNIYYKRALYRDRGEGNGKKE